MKLTKPLKVLTLTLPIFLVGCETITDFFDGDRSTAPSQTEVKDVPSTPPSPKKDTEKPSQSKQSLVIYASTSQSKEGFTLVEQKGQKIYVDARQTLSRSDLSDVIAVQDSSGKPLLNLHFSNTGSEKLKKITSNNTDGSLTVTYQGELLSILSIDKPVTDGVLNVPMNSADEASKIEQQILDGD